VRIECSEEQVKADLEIPTGTGVIQENGGRCKFTPHTLPLSERVKILVPRIVELKHIKHIRNALKLKINE